MSCFDLLETETNVDSISVIRFLLQVRQLCWGDSGLDLLLELDLPLLIGGRFIGALITLASFMLLPLLETGLLLAYWRFGDGLVSWRVRLGLRLVGRLVLTCFELLETGTDFNSIPAGRFLLQVRQLRWRLRLGLLIGAQLVFGYWRSLIRDLITLTSFIGDLMMDSLIGD